MIWKQVLEFSPSLAVATLLISAAYSLGKTVFLFIPTTETP